MSMDWRTVTVALAELKRAGPSSPTFGICYNFTRVVRKLFIDSTSDECDRILEHMFEELGLDSTYPVAHPHYDNNQAAFRMSSRLWDHAEEYGRNRWALLDQLIALAASKIQGDEA